LKKGGARPAGTKKLLLLSARIDHRSATARKSFLLLFFKKEDLVFASPVQKFYKFTALFVHAATA
jgi:hypothetical protein